MSFALIAAVQTVTHRAPPATVRRSLSAFCVNQIDFRSRANVSTAVRMVITAIRKGKSAFHARLDVPPVAATNA